MARVTRETNKKASKTATKKRGRGSGKVTREERRQRKINDQGTTLRMPLAWQKNTVSNSFIFAYNALQRKPSLRSRYIAKVVAHYPKSQGTVEEKHILFTMRSVECVQMEYDIKTLHELKTLFDTLDLEKVRKDLPKIEVPRMMLCGFTEENEELADTYWQLMALDVNERLEYIANAIFCYVADGFDFPELHTDAMYMLINWIERYRAGDRETKIAVMELFVRLGRFDESIREIKNLFVLPDGDNVGRRPLFVSESDIGSILK